MSMPLWVTETAEAFWAEAGELEPPPRDLRAPIATALPLTIVLLPRLRVVRVDEWLQEHANLCCVSIPDRALRACLIARYGHGIVFIDGADPDNEQRFSLAHELAHFLSDYWRPRRLAIERIGPEVLEVLDGERPASYDERAHALLAHVSIGFHVHLMERTEIGKSASAAIDRAENGADLLAYELLAPSADVLQQALAAPLERRQALVTELVGDVYGMPPEPAARYASLLVPPSRPPDSFVRRLGLVP